MIKVIILRVLRSISVIFYDTKWRLLSIGINHHIGKKINGIEQTVHAEDDAIRKLKKTNKYINIIIVRVIKNGYTFSAPCNSCFKKICKMGNVRNIYYSDYNGEFKRIYF